MYTYMCIYTSWTTPPEAPRPRACNQSHPTSQSLCLVAGARMWCCWGCRAPPRRPSPCTSPSSSATRSPPPLKVGILIVRLLCLYRCCARHSRICVRSVANFGDCWGCRAPPRRPSPCTSPSSSATRSLPFYGVWFRPRDEARMSTNVKWCLCYLTVGFRCCFGLKLTRNVG